MAEPAAIQAAPEKPARRWPRRIAKGFGTLVLFAALALVGFETFRQIAIQHEITKLKLSRERLNAEVLKGRTPREFFEDRTKGKKNGWTEYVGLIMAVRELEGRKIGRLYPKRPVRASGKSDESNNDEPTQQELRDFLEATTALSPLAEKLSRYDLISGVPDLYDREDEQRISSLDPMTAYRMLATRVEAHWLLGENAAAWREVVALVKLTDLFTMPGNLITGVVDASLRLGAWELAADLSADKNADIHVLSAMLALPPPESRDFEMSIEGESLYLEFMAIGGRIYQGDRWFDWVIADDNPVDLYSDSTDNFPALAYAAWHPFRPLRTRAAISQFRILLLDQLAVCRAKSAAFAAKDLLPEDHVLTSIHTQCKNLKQLREETLACRTYLFLRHHQLTKGLKAGDEVLKNAAPADSWVRVRVEDNKCFVELDYHAYREFMGLQRKDIEPDADFTERNPPLVLTLD